MLLDRSTTLEDRQTVARFLAQVSRETEVWVANDPDHIVHFNGKRFLEPYPDTFGVGKQVHDGTTATALNC